MDEKGQLQQPILDWGKQKLKYLDKILHGRLLQDRDSNVVIDKQSFGHTMINQCSEEEQSFMIISQVVIVFLLWVRQLWPNLGWYSSAILEVHYIVEDKIFKNQTSRMFNCYVYRQQKLKFVLAAVLRAPLMQ